MAHLKKISTTLSVAATVLLEACSSGGSDSASAPAAVANTTAPELVGTWATDCVATAVSNTTTQASGGGGGGSASGGAAYRNTAVFTQQGHVEYTTESYATSDCNENKLSGFGVYNAVYFIGAAGFDTNGGSVTEFSYSDASSTTYTIFYANPGDSLYLGDGTVSSAGNTGGSTTTRIDTLGERMLKQ
mgnify:CR=1 FL=1